MLQHDPQKELAILADRFVEKYRGFDANGDDDGAGVSSRDLTLTERQDLTAAVMAAEGGDVIDRLEGLRPEYLALMFSQIASATEEVDLFDFRHTLRNHFEGKCSASVEAALDAAYERARIEDDAKNKYGEHAAEVIGWL